ncbi:hypothetical protein HY498_04540 [Candidatus Woesearchaeota archaeon]|nr:hypothetical protein [Candidatus Woesearchaeota archaeon]
MRKKGVSAILGTVMILTIIIIIGIIVFLYSKKSTLELLQSTEKFETSLGSPLCNEVIMKINKCECPLVEPGQDMFCEVTVVNEGGKNIKEITYALFLNQDVIGSGKQDVNLLALSGIKLSNIKVNNVPSKIELKPTKVIFNNREINCGSKISLGGCFR